MAKCLVCGVEVEYPDFKCKKYPGNHRVENKTYFHTGGKEIQDIKDRRRFSPNVILLPSYEYRDPNDPARVQKTNGVSVQFTDGKFETEDGELQWYLENKGFPSGEEGLKMWREIYLTPEQNKNIVQAELEALQKQVKETNSLLEQVQKSKGK